VRVLRWVSNVWIMLLVLNLLLSTLLVGGRHVIPMLSTEPRLRTSTPLDGARDVPVRLHPKLEFDQPMNPRSVELALTITPALPALQIWDPSFTTLTISPTLSLSPATDYALTIAATAMSRQLRPLASAVSLDFRTIAAPAVQATIPSAGSRDVAVETPLLIVFSRMMVPTDATMRDVVLPELQFDPPLRGRARWIDQSTLLFQPDRALATDTSYQVTLTTSLTDLDGGQLGQPVSWGFRTAAPAVLASAPAADARDIGLRTPLVVTITQALEPARLSGLLVITPTTSVQIDETALPSGAQVISFTPTAGWQPASRYVAELRLGERSAAQWSLTTAPRLALTGRFPGEGQVLPTDQEIRLVFSTPVDPEALQALARLDPPDSALRVRGSGGELRIGASLRAATSYTLTIPPDLTDRNGALLGVPTTVRFVTAPAPPILSAPEAERRLIQQPPGAPLALLLRRTNISALSVDLYDLDEATVVRTLVFDDGDWAQFDPERYQQPLRRSWTLPLSDTLNAIVEDRMLVEVTPGEPLPPGLYYLRARTPEGPRIDLILSVTNTALALEIGATGGVAWATDLISGTVAPNLPVALYQDDALILEGVTDSAGLLPFNLVGGQPHLYTALARGAIPTLVTVGPLTLPPARALDSYRLFVATDRSTYRPGETVRVGGVVRQVISETLALPSTPVDARMRLIGPGGRILAETTVATQASGSFSLDAPLALSLTPGRYQLQVDAAGTTQQIELRLAAEQPADRRVRVVLPQSPAATTVATATLVLETLRGLPRAHEPISWTLSVEPARPPLPDGYLPADPETPPIARSGGGLSDERGLLTIPISITQAAQLTPLRYRLVAESAGAASSAEVTTAPAQLSLGVRPGRALFLADDPVLADALVVDADGRPVAGITIQAQLLRADGSSERPIATRRAVTSADGTAQLSLPPSGGGAYLLRIAGVDTTRPLGVSERPVWVAGRPPIPAGTPALIADRASYVLGEVATLLPVLPGDGATTALLTIERGGAVAPQVVTVQAGEVISTTLTPNMAPATQARLRSAGTRQSPAIVTETTLGVGTTTDLPRITIDADRSAYAAGATAALTVTVRGETGATLPADLLVAVVVDDQPLAAGMALAGPYARALDQASARPANQPAGRGLLAGPESATLYWSGPVRLTDGALSIALQLPRSAMQLRVVAWAAGDTALSQAERTIAIEQPLSVYLDAPPFLRPGDQIELAARILSHATITQTVTVRLESDDLAPASVRFSAQTIELAPLGSARLTWAALAGARPLARVSVTAQTAQAQAQAVEQIALAAAAVPYREQGALVDGRAIVPFRHAGTGGMTLDLAASPDAVAVGVAQRARDQATGSVLDDAALLLTSAPLTETQSIARAALGRLIDAQHDDGGWGWWPALEAHPAVTAVVLEALAAADAAGIAVPEPARALGVAWGDRAIGQIGNLDQRAQLAYALTLHGRSAAAEVAQIEIARLSAQGCAALLLASAPEEAQVRAALLQRIEALALRDSGQPIWIGDAAGVMDDTAATAMVGLALEAAERSSPLSIEIRQTLAGRRGVNGWGDPLATARALQFLRVSWPSVQQPSGMTVDLNGERLLVQTSGPMTATHRIELAGARLKDTNTLTITADGPLLLSYRLDQAVAASQAAGPVQFIYERADQRTQPLSLASLSPERPIMIRMTLLVRERVPFAQIVIPLPPGVAVELQSSAAPLALVQQTPSRMIFASHALEAGVYELRYELRPSYAGEFQLPPPELGRGGKIVYERAVP
jgi:alpha-2-macroglobulin